LLTSSVEEDGTMTIPTTLITVAIAAALATGCTTHRTALRTDERIVFIPPSAPPSGRPEGQGQTAPGIQGTVTHIERAAREATVVTADGETLTVQLQPVTAGLLREGDTIQIDVPVVSRAR
jgi:quercetin dioxygenase-like cupin family protein